MNQENQDTIQEEDKEMVKLSRNVHMLMTNSQTVTVTIGIETTIIVIIGMMMI